MLSGAKFPGFGSLLTGYRESTIKIRFFAFSGYKKRPGTRSETRHISKVR